MKTYRTAKAALVDSAGNFLLLRRSGTHPTMALDMDLPGGIVEVDEQPSHCLIREIAEETKLKISDDNLKLFFAMTEDFHGRSAVRQVFLARLNSLKPAINLSWEHDKYDWLPLDQAIAALPPERYITKALCHLKNNDLLKELD